MNKKESKKPLFEEYEDFEHIKTKFKELAKKFNFLYKDIKTTGDKPGILLQTSLADIDIKELISDLIAIRKDFESLEIWGKNNHFVMNLLFWADRQDLQIYVFDS